ncbi:AsnC family transcriptional regulator [Desulfovibrio sp. UCD-KL4C]|uniref:siroheme decarboxylase subunit alpha n=1 Tax=Desulfovibrio sp. UCD-KL4C TaxID=2578120 RepID=UPI0025BF7BE7|nr:AsnC family transcriptional regulator [Desulfovibrio sp. UCD-KL4C]
MDAVDKQILGIIQSEFPIATRPYAVVGEKIGITEEETLSRVTKLRKDGVIRRIGANFGSRELGWKSTLCAAKVPEDKIDEFVTEVNRHKGVTHNYLRENEFNIWFTYIGTDLDNVVNTLQSITDKTGIKILNLPASSMFKIKVDFNMDDDKEND